MTALRTMEGLDLALVSTRFGKDFSNTLLTASNKWAATQKLIVQDQMIILTKEGKLFADGIAADLFF
jgi:oxygen-independent coproporphyrinogen-3 oxidase